MNFIRYFLMSLIILFQVIHEKEIYGIEISGIEVLDEVLREIVEYTPYPLKTIENLKLVSKDFYDFVSREFFGIIDCLSFKENLKLKKMFLIFLDQEDQDRINKIEKIEFMMLPIADDFKQAMLEALKTNHFSESPNLIQKLNQQIECFKSPIAKDLLSICCQYGFGVKQDKFKAQELEKKMISDLSSSNQLLIPWDIQIWKDPIFIEWFKRAEILMRLQWAQDYLSHSTYMYARMEYIKNWLQSNEIQKEIIEFIKNQDLPNFYSKLQVCAGYFSLLGKLDLLKNQFSAMTFIQNWLVSETSKEDVLLALNFKERSKSSHSNMFLFFEITKTAVLYGKLLKFFNIPKNYDFLNKVLEEFVDYFSLQSEYQYFFLGKVRVAQFFSDLEESFINPVNLQKFGQNWLKAEKKKVAIIEILTKQIERLPDSFFFKYWKDYCSMAVYWVQKNSGLKDVELLEKKLEEVGINCIQVFFNPGAEVDISLQIKIAGYLIEECPNTQIIQCIKKWLNLEKIQKNLKIWLNQFNQYDEKILTSIQEDYQCIQFIQFISKLNWLIELGYFKRINRFLLYYCFDYNR